MLLYSKTLHLAGTRKLRARYVGPFRIIKYLGKMAYRLEVKQIRSATHPTIYGWLRVQIRAKSSKVKGPGQPTQ